jgi:membrane-associated phospholipid phosphatase
LTAMPSVHVAWAVLVAVVVVSLSTSAWRWLAVIYPALTMTAVVATGNHFWADGIVGAAIVAIAVVADRFAHQLRFARSVKELAPVRT